MISFQTAPNEDQLATELSSDLYTYISRRKKNKQCREIEKNSQFYLSEVIRYSRIPRGIDLSKPGLNDKLEKVGWHLQIHDNLGPRFYARASFYDTWDVDWIGECWLAEHIAAGIAWLDERENTLPNANVQLLSSRMFRFSSFWLDVDDPKHVVVSAHPEIRGELPMFTWLTPGELGNHLLNAYGPDYSKGGIRK